MIKLNKIHLINYLTHRDFSLEFDYPFFELKEQNEFGKSTILSAISDVFSFNPLSLVNKATKGSGKEPVIELDFALNDISYTIILNGQEGSVLLRGEDGTYLTSKSSIKDLFKQNGYQFFPYVVKNLLFLKERDLSINSDSAEFKKFTKDILNVEKINKLISIVDKIILKNKGFKAGQFGKLYGELEEKSRKLRSEIISLESDFEKYSMNLERYNELDKKIEMLSQNISEKTDNINTIDAIISYKIKEEHEKKLKKTLDELDDVKKQIEYLTKKIKQLSFEKKEKEKCINDLLNLRKDIEFLKQKKRELNTLIELKEKTKKYCIDLLNKNKSIKQTIDEISQSIDGVNEEIKNFHNKRLKLEKELNNIIILKEKNAFILRERKRLEKEFKKLEHIKVQIGDLEDQIKDYITYDINFLKKLITDMDILNGLIKSSMGRIEVKKGSIFVNDKLINKGNFIQFKGEAHLSNDSFIATVTTNEEISKIKKRLAPYLKVFKSRENLFDIIKKLERYNELKKQYQKEQVDEIKANMDKLLKQEIEIKRATQEEENLKTNLDEIKEKENKHNDKKQILTQKLRKLEKEYSENNGKLVAKQNDLKKIDVDIQVLKLEIDKKACQLYGNGFEDISLDDVKAKIEEVKQEIENISRQLTEATSNRSAYIEKANFLEKELSSIKKELTKIGDIDSQIEGLSYGQVKKYESYTPDELHAIKQELDDELKKAMDEKEVLIKEYSELKGILTHVPDFSMLEQKRRELEDSLIKLSSMDKIEGILRGSRQVLELLRQNIEEKYLSSLSDATSKNFFEITKGNYSKVVYNDNTIFSGKENFSKSWMAISKQGVEFTFDELSDGAKTQLLLAVRLALISSFFGNNRAFLLLDEPFAYFDYQRTEKARKLLDGLAKKGWQIILVSAKVLIS